MPLPSEQGTPGTETVMTGRPHDRTASEAGQDKPFIIGRLSRLAGAAGVTPGTNINMSAMAGEGLPVASLGRERMVVGAPDGLLVGLRSLDRV